MTQYRALFFLTAAVVLQAPTLQGQDPRPTPGVTFQVEVNYVDVDVVVTDEHGEFVTGLTRDDFEVFEDGRPQKVDTFSLEEIPVERLAELSSTVARFPPKRRQTGRRSTDACTRSSSTIST